jgi:hypothetical protein
MYRPSGSQKVEAPAIYRQSANESGKIVGPAHRSPLNPKENPGYSFLLEAESNPGPQCGQKD